MIQAENFVLILSKNALERCNEDNDWVRKEIAMAIEYNLNIVVLQEQGFWYPEGIPDDIKDITKYQAIEYTRQTMREQVEMLSPMLKLPQDQFASIEKISSDGKIKISGKYITLYEEKDRGANCCKKSSCSTT